MRLRLSPRLKPATSDERISSTVYEPGGGYQAPGGGISLRGFLIVLLVLAAFIAVNEMVDRYFGHQALSAAINLLLGASLARAGIHAILNAERLEDVVTKKDARRARLSGIISLMIGTVIAAFSVRTLLPLVEGW